MNPAALKTNLKDLVKGGTLIVNKDAFTERNLDKAGYAANPLEDGSLGEFQVHDVGLTSMTLEALKEIDVSKREAERAKNMFALGLMSWLFHRPTEGTLAFLDRKFAKVPNIREANIKAFQSGYAYGETTETFAVSYEVKPATLDARHLSQHHREPGARVRADRRVEAAAGCRSSSARIRSRPRRRSSRSSRGTRASASAPSRRRTRSPP